MARLRVEKVQEAIKQELSKMLLMDIKDPRIQFVTITGVELTDDMSIAKVYVSLYGPEKDHEAAWQGLNKALGFMRTEIAKRIRLRFAPNWIAGSLVMLLLIRLRSKEMISGIILTKINT